MAEEREEGVRGTTRAWLRHPVREAREWRRRRNQPTPMGEHQVPSLELPEDVDEVAVTVIELASLSRRWVHRIAETIVLNERAKAKRCVTVYFTLPSEGDVGGGSVSSDGICLVPLALTAKRRLSLFHTTDESGLRVPTVTRTARERLTTSALRQMAEAQLEGELPQALRDDLEALGCDEPQPAQLAADRFRAAHEKYGVPPRPKGVAPGAADDARARLWDVEALRSVLTELATNRLVLIPLAPRANSRRVLSFEYEEDVERRRLRLRWANRSLLGTRLWRGIFKGLGWRATKLQFGASAVADAGSYHMELEVPRGLQFSRVELVATDPDTGGRIPLDETKGSSTRAHVATRNVPRIESAYVAADVRLQSSTVIRGAWFGALFVTIVLALGGIYLDDLEPGAGPALLLVFPGLLSLYLGGQGEAGMLTKMAFRIRSLAVVPAAAAFVAAGLVVAASGDRATGTLWWFLVGAAGTAWLLLSGTWYAARWRRPPE